MLKPKGLIEAEDDLLTALKLMHRNRIVVLPVFEKRKTRRRSQGFGSIPLCGVHFHGIAEAPCPEVSRFKSLLGERENEG